MGRCPGFNPGGFLKVITNKEKCEPDNFKSYISLPDPIHPTLAGEIMDRLYGILTSLQWNVFILWSLEGYTYHEIAQKWRKTAKSVERALCRIREKIEIFSLKVMGF